MTHAGSRRMDDSPKDIKRKVCRIKRKEERTKRKNGTAAEEEEPREAD